jgi:hypothetical protein
LSTYSNQRRSRGWRILQRYNHWRKRCKYQANLLDKLITSEGTIDHPTVIDVMKSDFGKIYKTTGTPCSCSLCTAERKYDREQAKKEEREELNEQWQDYENDKNT